MQLNNIYNASWDDVAFDISLRAVVQPSIGSTLNVLGRDATGAHLMIDTPLGTIWKLESNDGDQTTWQLIQTVPGGLQPILDSGQNGRPHPSQVKSRFYRLRPF